MFSYEKETKELFEEILSLSSNISYRKYDPEEVVVIEGDRIDKIGFVEYGLLNAVNYTKEGKVALHDYFKETNIIPVYLYLSGIENYTYTLEVVKDTKIAWISTDEFTKAAGSSKELMERMIIHLSKRAYLCQIQMRCVSFKLVSERLAYWIIEMNNINDKDYIELPETQRMWANILNVNRSSFNQELNKMIKNQFIEIENNELRILDKEEIINMY